MSTAIPRPDISGVDSHDVDVPVNVAELLTEYVRSNTIRNEQVFHLLQYGFATAFLSDPHSYNSGVLIGTSSSGKTHVFDKAEELYTHVDVYDATSGSGKSMVYDDEWDSSTLALLDELQKPPEELVEFLKSVHGGDEKFVYRTVTGSVKEGFSTEKIERYAMPYWFLYAQSHKDADFEMWNRLLKLPVHESESKNRAVGKMAFGHNGIHIGGEDVEYGFDFEQGKWELQQHIRILSENAPYNVWLPSGDQFGWNIWDIVEPIFSHSRSESNRIYHMVANEIKGSTVLNYHTRRSATIGGTEYLIATPQDVANVLRCREKLLATTHELDHKRRSVVNAIETRGGKAKEVLGVDPIVEELEQSDAPSVKKSELENIIGDLVDNYIINVHEGAGDGNEDIYESLGWDELGYARVAENRELFEDVTDPIGGISFLDWHNGYRAESSRDAQEMMEKGAASSSKSTTATTDDGSATLGSYGNDEDNTEDLDLDETEEFVLDRAQLLDGERIEDLSSVPVEAFVGLVRPNDSNAVVDDPEGTPLDPEHDLWDRPRRDDSWIQSVQQARRQLKQAVDALIDAGHISYGDIHETDESGSPVDVTLDIATL